MALFPRLVRYKNPAPQVQKQFWNRFQKKVVRILSVVRHNKCKRKPENYLSDIPLTDLRSLACRGDKDAYGRLVKQHVGLVFGVCMGVLGDRHEAEDATQQVFLKGFTEIGKLKNSEQFAAWVCRIGRNLCIDIVRRRELERNAIKTHVRKNKDDASERFLSLESALGRLPEKYRVVLMLFYFDECKSKRIGQVLGISESAVHMRLMRARQELRKILENEREL